jgi:membrane protease YdiL (CAAX protease family)
MLEQLDQLFSPNIPTWQLYLFVAVIPAIAEEITFRGILLNGLRRKVRPLLLPFAVGIIFGLFHFALFRIGPTAFLGVLLTIIALLTGSIFPGMLLHGLNNAFGVWASEHMLPLASLEWWHYCAATAIFGLAMWIVYRNRTPYPL